MSSLSIAYRNRRMHPKQGGKVNSASFTIGALFLFVSGATALAQTAPAPGAPRLATGKEVRIAAAADLQTVMPALAQRYEQATGVKLVVSFGSSGNLATQIFNGLPVDLFLGADYTFPEKIVAAKLADSPDAIPYARGTLVLWARNDSGFAPLSLDTLSDPRLKSIAVADETRAPYGRAAVAALTHMKLYDQLKPKLVIGENISQAGQFVQSGNAQLGLISLTMAMSEQFRKSGSFVLVPKVYPEIRQCGVVMVKSDHRAEAHAFLNWLLSSPIQAELPKLGLEPVQ